MMKERCPYCGCFLTIEDNSYLGQGGWVENEAIYCSNPKCKGLAKYGIRPKEQSK